MTYHLFAGQAGGTKHHINNAHFATFMHQKPRFLFRACGLLLTGLQA